MTPSEEYTQRYMRVEREKDALGRLIGVRKLRPSQEERVKEYTPNLDGETERVVLDEETGVERTIRIAKRFNLFMAACVCEIDGNQIPFARNRGELDAIYDRLDNEGIEAAVVAFARWAPKKDGGEEAGSTIDEAKK